MTNAYPYRVGQEHSEREPLASKTALRSLRGPGEERSTVLVIDNIPANLDHLRDLLEHDGYRVITARQGADALEMLRATPVDLVILDLFLPDMAGAEFCRRLRSDHRTELTPVFMLSSVQEVEDEIAGIGSGADAFLARPFHPEIFGARVRAMLRHKARVVGLEDSETILLALARAVELRDPSTAGHCDHLAALAVTMGMTMGLPPAQLSALHYGGHLHDIGKLAMPDAILFKKGPLTEEEWVIMRTHTVMGETICRPVKSFSPVLPIIRNHHERWDGSGYPDGLAGRDIPLLVRILQFADIYDALTSDRCYKPAMNSPAALRIMQEETSRGWYDPELMRIFMTLPHDLLCEASHSNAERSQDPQGMRASLEKLRISILRS